MLVKRGAWGIQQDPQTDHAGPSLGLTVRGTVVAAGWHIRVSIAAFDPTADWRVGKPRLGVDNYPPSVRPVTSVRQIVKINVIDLGTDSNIRRDIKIRRSSGSPEIAGK